MEQNAARQSCRRDHLRRRSGDAETLCRRVFGLATVITIIVWMSSEYFVAANNGRIDETAGRD